MRRWTMKLNLQCNIFFVIQYEKRKSNEVNEWECITHDISCDKKVCKITNDISFKAIITPSASFTAFQTVYIQTNIARFMYH